MSAILMRENKVFAEITGAKVNRGAGYGLKVPCVYRLYGPNVNVYVDKMNNCEGVSWALVEYLLADLMGLVGGSFILLLFIGVMAADCWSELGGGCFWEFTMY